MDGWEALPEGAQKLALAQLKASQAIAAIEEAGPASQPTEAMHIDDAVQSRSPPQVLEKKLTNMNWWSDVDWDSLHDRIRTISFLPPHLHAEVADIRAALMSL